MLTRALLFFLFTIGLTSCGSHKKRLLPQKPKKVVKKKRVKKSPKQRLREEAIERYRLMRLQAMKNRWNSERPSRTRKAPAKIIVRGKQKPAPRTRQKILANPEELKIEIDQNLAYYCMSRRKKFAGPTDCQQLTQNILQECEDKFDRDDRGLLRCVKSRLRF